MDKPINNISLKFKCPAKWSEMRDLGGAHYCTHCNQKVYDFTNTKEQEFLNILAENGNNVCGRYTRAQIAPVYAAQSSWKKWLSAAVMFLGINMFSGKVRAQLVAVYSVPEKQVIKDDDDLFVGRTVFAGRVDREKVEKEAEFPGGENALNNFVAQHVDKTQELRTGRSDVIFTIEADGSISNCKIERGLGPSNDAEVIRIVKLMPRWKPAIANGKAIASEYILPFDFH
jgi:hypothetical protein